MDEKMWAWYSRHSANYSTSILPTLNRPRSRGHIRLRSSDPRDHPLIQPNYLADQRDVDTLVAGIRKALQLLDTAAMRGAGAQLWAEQLPHCAHLAADSAEYWECYVRAAALTVYHPVGTCAMGPVLDSRLRVRGLQRLRVVDGSAMPKLVGGNTNAPIIMMAEKGADMIIQDFDINRNNHVEMESNRVEL